MPDTATPKGFDRVIRAIGFTHRSSFILWFILAGALTGFTSARFQYLNFEVFCPANGIGGGAAPGECYWFLQSRYKIGILLHLGTILPASLLAVLQFTPFIRKTYRTYHRIAGYLATSLGIISIAGVLMIADKSFGGTTVLQAFFGALSIAFVLALGLAIYNIRKLQIDQHRAWMLRAWIWAGSIITLRIIFIIAANIISAYPPSQRLYITYRCDVLAFMIRDPIALIARYHTCSAIINSTSPLGNTAQAAVQANFSSKNIEEISAALQAAFPVGAWLAWLIHAVGVEMYLNLTPGETERLRQYSYERQVQAGLRRPDSSGTNSDRFGESVQWVSASKSDRGALEAQMGSQSGIQTPAVLV